MTEEKPTGIKAAGRFGAAGAHEAYRLLVVANALVVLHDWSLPYREQVYRSADSPVRAGGNLSPSDLDAEEAQALLRSRVRPILNISLRNSVQGMKLG